jgi:hypothetical protein
MEKFRIGMYGMAQVMAIVYGVLGCGAAVKLNKPAADDGFRMSSVYYLASYFREYGYFLLLFVIGWAIVMAYQSSWGSREVDENEISTSGIALTIGFILLGTFLAFGAAMPPGDLLTHKP